MSGTSDPAIAHIEAFSSDREGQAYVAYRAGSFGTQMKAKNRTPTMDDAIRILRKACNKEVSAAEVYIDSFGRRELDLILKDWAKWNPKNHGKNRCVTLGLRDEYDVVIKAISSNSFGVLMQMVEEEEAKAASAAEEEFNVDEANRVVIPAFDAPEIDLTGLGALIDQLIEFVVDRENDLMGFVKAALFEGFNREIIQMECFKRFSNQGIFVISAIVALRGPEKVRTEEKIRELPIQMLDGTVRSLGNLLDQVVIKPEKTKSARKLRNTDLTLGRINAAFPDLAAFALLRLEEMNLLQKRVEDCDLPAWLQFPQSASLPLDETGRNAQIDFTERFSELIGSSFNYNIYRQQSTKVLRLKGRIGAILMSAYSHLTAYENNFTYDDTVAEEEEEEESSESGAAAGGAA